MADIEYLSSDQLEGRFAGTEGEKAAAEYGCVGAHRMGEKWMPCETH